MKVLAIETSTLTGSVALLEDDRVVEERVLSNQLQHSVDLMPAIDEVLSKNKMPLSGIDLFAVGNGPGSFTGLRIGIATAQGLALPFQKPLVGISSLHALACQGADFEGLVIPCLNAYRNEIYWGLYQKVPGTFWLEPVLEDRVTSVEMLLKEVKERDEKALFLGHGYDASHPKASHVGFLALEQWKKGERSSTVLPRYLRSPG